MLLEETYRKVHQNSAEYGADEGLEEILTKLCGAKGKLEAHEKWSYDEQKALQKLEDVLALCHACHEVKHVSRTQLVGRGMDAMEHFMRVNGCSQSDFHAALGEANAAYLRRNKIEGWTTDVSWLARLGINLK